MRREDEREARKQQNDRKRDKRGLQWKERERERLVFPPSSLLRERPSKIDGARSSVNEVGRYTRLIFSRTSLLATFDEDI
jgi:hypothetical protein